MFFSRRKMFSGKSCSTVASIISLFASTNAFSAPATRLGLARQQVNKVSLDKSLSIFDGYHLNHARTKTALSEWPGSKDDKKESEGKRASDSRLSLSGDTNEVSLFFGISSTKSVEEFVAPVSKVLDDQTGGWALSYANLEPEDETTPIGISFLATNIAYGLTGTLLMANGNILLGALTELACVASFFYHYSQLKYGQRGSRIVRLTLLVDYFFAVSAILVGGVQLFLSHQLPAEALYSGTLAIATLGACWIWEEGLVYIFFHSLWHLFSALTGYIIGSIQ